MDRVVEVFNLVNSSGTPAQQVRPRTRPHLLAVAGGPRRVPGDAGEHTKSRTSTSISSFYTRCTTIVATGSALYEPLYKTPIDEVEAAWPKVTKALDYVLNVLRGDAYIDAASTFPSTHSRYPARVPISRARIEPRSTLIREAELPALDVRRDDVGPIQRELRDEAPRGHRGTQGGRSAGPAPRQLDPRSRSDQGRGEGPRSAACRSPFFPMTYVVARSRGAVDWFKGVAALPEGNRQVVRPRDPSHLSARPPLQVAATTARTPRTSGSSTRSPTSHTSQSKRTSASPRRSLRSISEGAREVPRRAQAAGRPAEPGALERQAVRELPGGPPTAAADAINTYMDSLLQSRISRA